jgi:DHA2 family multidrug resistance protein
MQVPIQGSKAAITVTVMAAALMAMIDISIVNVALSDIRASFGTPIDQIGWVSTGYMMANIVVIPMTGWLQRRFGFRRYFSTSVLIFTIASALCGLAWDLPSLVAFRILQGMGGGAIIPTSQAILFARYPRTQHGMAAALFGLGAITGPLLGPTIGGYMIDWASWHWIFLVNVPIGLVVAFALPRVLQEPGFRPDTTRIDAVGIGLLAVGMASLQYVLEEGNREGWSESTRILVLGGVAAIAIITFIAHELEHPNPVVDLRVFKNRNYAAGTGLNFLLGLAVFGAAYLFSLYCGAVMRYQALDIGRVFLLAGLSQIFLMPLIGKMANRIDPRYLLVFGVTTTAVSQWVAAQLNADAAFGDLVFPQLIRSLGLAFVFVPVSVAVRPAARPARQRDRPVQPHPRARRLARHGVDGQDHRRRDLHAFVAARRARLALQPDRAGGLARYRARRHEPAGRAGEPGRAPGDGAVVQRWLPDHHAVDRPGHLHGDAAPAGPAEDRPGGRPLAPPTAPRIDLSSSDDRATRGRGSQPSHTGRPGARVAGPTRRAGALRR